MFESGGGEISALRDANQLLQLAKELSAWIRGQKDDSLRIECMNGLGVYVTTVHVESTFAKWAQKIGNRSKDFPLDQVYDVKMYSLKPTVARIEGAVTRGGEKISVDILLSSSA